MLQSRQSSALATKNSAKDGALRIVWSGAKKIGLHKIETFKKHVKITEEHKEVQDSTTHVILETDDCLMANQRSRKYLGGCAAGCWLVSSAWIEACIAAGARVPEETYQVRGVHVSKPGLNILSLDSKSIGAPERSRIQRLQGKRKIFAGIKFIVAPFKGKASEEAEARRIIVKRLILLGQGSARDLCDIDNDKSLNSTSTVISDDEKIAKDLKQRGFGTIIVPSWVYDCLTVGELLDKEQYKTPHLE